MNIKPIRNIFSFIFATLRPRGKMNIKPIRDNLLIRLIDKQEDEKVGSLYVPQRVVNYSRTRRAEIMALGESVDSRFKVGDIVLISFYVGVELDNLTLKLDKAEYRIITDKEILGFWTE